MNLEDEIRSAQMEFNSLDNEWDKLNSSFGVSLASIDYAATKAREASERVQQLLDQYKKENGKDFEW